MRVDDYNRKFNLEDDYSGEEDELNDENAMAGDDDYDEDERDDDESDFPPSIFSTGAFVPFICF